MSSTKYLTREELRLKIKERTGIGIGKSTMDKRCMPSLNQGPPVAAYWGNKPLYEEEPGIEWALSCLRPAAIQPAT
jgi:hypothetical protein